MMLLVGLFASCSKDGTEENSDNPVQPGPSGKYYCTTDMPDDWVLGWSDSWVSFPLITNIAEFKVTVSESWLTAEVQPTADAGKKELMVRVEKYDLRDASGNNIFAEPRIAKVHITGGGVFDRSVSIVQNSHVQITLPSLPYVDANQVLYLTADGETQDVAVSANCYRWRVSSNVDWLTVTVKDRSTITISSKPRTSGGPRRTSVKVYNEANAASDFCTFTVADKDAVLTGNDFDYGESTAWD